MERDLVVNPKLQLDIYGETGVGVQGFQIGARDFKNGFGIGFNPETDSSSEVITAQRGLDIPFQEITHAAKRSSSLSSTHQKNGGSEANLRGTSAKLRHQVMRDATTAKSVVCQRSIGDL
jgi:hypothetical protein